MLRCYTLSSVRCSAVASTLILAGILSPPAARAHSEHKTLFVSANGSDKSDCRDTKTPCKTLEQALKAAGKGDRIKVAEGTYSFLSGKPEEGLQLLGHVVAIEAGFDGKNDFARIEDRPARTFLTGPADRYRAALEEKGMILLKGDPDTFQLAQAETPADTGPDKLFVTPEGSDAGDCTDPDAPCATLTYALSVAAAGDTIAAASGNFIMSQDLLARTRARNITLEGGYEAGSNFAVRTGAQALSYVVGPSFTERAELLEQGFHLVQDSKYFDIVRAESAQGTSAPAAAPAECIGGSAGGHPCKGLDLLARIPLSGFSSNPNGANDIWGFVDLNDKREYAIIGLRNGTAVVDVTDPANPTEVGTIPGLQTIWRDVKVLQTFDSAADRWKAYAYVTADSVNQSFQIIDLTALPASISLAATVNAFASAHNIYMANIDYATGRPLPGETPFAYILGSNLQSGAFRILEFSNPLAPTTVTMPPVGTGYIHDASSMLVTDARTADCAAGHNPCEVLIDYNETSVDFWDVTDKAAPVKLSSLTYPNAEYTHSGWWSKDKKFVYIQDELDEQRTGINTRVVIVDLSDLKNPSIAGNWNGPTKAIDHNGFTLDDEYYMSNYRRGLTVLDIADPKAPSEKLFFDTFVSPAENDAVFNGAWGTYPYLPSGTILVSDIEGGLFLLKKSDETGPTPPRPRGRDLAFAWANKPTALAYAPSATYAYNPSGPIKITRSGIGTYAVNFAGFGGSGKAGGNVQVTAYGKGATRCKVRSWSSGTQNFIANVRCMRANGKPADERFSILVNWQR